MAVTAALRTATIALVAALVVIGCLAARRARLPVWQRLIVILPVQPVADYAETIS